MARTVKWHVGVGSDEDDGEILPGGVQHALPG